MSEEETPTPSLEDEFKAFLEKKKIDPKAFAQTQPEMYQEFLMLFEQVSPKSLVAQKLFVINKIRREFPLKEASSTSAAAAKPKRRAIIKR